MINNSAPGTKKIISPRDGPATTFHSDHNLPRIYQSQPGNDFGAIIVAGWPPNIETMQTPYSHFLDKVRESSDE